MNLEAVFFRYIKAMDPPIRRYFMQLPACCKKAYICADAERTGDVATFDCAAHGHVDVNLDLAVRVLRAAGKPRHVVVACGCGQKNRIDVARVIAESMWPRCGKCGEAIRWKP